MSHEATAWAYKQKLSSGPKFVLVCLADFTDADYECWPAVKKICEMTGLSDQTVRSHLQQLEGDGLISRTPRFRDNKSQTSSLYKLSVGGATENLGTLEPPDINHHKEPPLTPGDTRSPHEEFYKGRQEGARKQDNRESEYDSWPDSEKEKPKVSNLNSKNLAVDFNDQAKVECGGLTVTDVPALIGNLSRFNKAGIKYEEIQACIEYFFKVRQRYIYKDQRPWQAFVTKFQQIRKDCDWTDPTEKQTYKSFERPKGSRILDS